jgi:hypothetical protein
MGTEPGLMMSPHARFAHMEFRTVRELRVFRKSGHWLIESTAQVEEEARTRSTVVPPLAQCLEQGVARELGHKIAGEAADRAEGRGARPCGAGATLVVVAVAHHTDAKALLERVVQDPLERAPS